MLVEWQASKLAWVSGCFRWAGQREVVVLFSVGSVLLQRESERASERARAARTHTCELEARGGLWKGAFAPRAGGFCRPHSLAKGSLLAGGRPVHAEIGGVWADGCKASARDKARILSLGSEKRGDPALHFLFLFALLH